MENSLFVSNNVSRYVINFLLFQIYLLAAPPSKTVTALFRIHLNLLNGPLLAFLFPETASRTVSIKIN